MGPNDTNFPEVQKSLDGSRPLKNYKQELFAKNRALGLPLVEAARRSGYETMSSRHVYRLAKYPQVAARIQYLTGMSDELIREKRNTVERELNRIAYANMADFISIKNGVPALDWAKIQEYDEAARRDVLGAVKRIKFDKDGGVSFELHGKLEALAQLSKLNGFDKVEGSRSTGGEYERMSESELVAELSRQANELGLNITLSIDGTDGERSRHRDVVDGRKPTALVGAPRSLKNR